MKLPDELFIPKPTPLNQIDVSDFGSALIREKPYSIETETGTYSLQKMYAKGKDFIVDIAEAHKHTFFICPPGQFDSLMKFFPNSMFSYLELGQEVELSNGWTLIYRGSSIRLRNGLKYKYLWNLWKFFKFDKQPESLDKIEIYATLLLKYLNKHGIEFSSLASLPSVSRHMMIRHAWREWNILTHDPGTIEKFALGSYGGRQESTGIGTMPSVNYDMQKAHLAIIEDLPNLYNCKVYRGKAFLGQDCNYGTYLIETGIPKMKICPLPQEVNVLGEREVIYGYGGISGWYAKPYLELLKKLGIPFTILDSIQLIPTKFYKPFRYISNIVRTFIEQSPDYFNGKGLYYGIAGSCVSWRKSLTKEGEIIQKAFPVFSPILYGHTLAVQNCRVFTESMKDEPIAIRSDAVTTKRKITTTLRLDSVGDTIFFTNMYKKFPGGKGGIWEELINIDRERPYVEYYINDFPTLSSAALSGRRLGKRVDYSVRVYPSHGHRIGRTPKFVAELLHSWIPSTPPRFLN